VAAAQETVAPHNDDTRARWMLQVKAQQTEKTVSWKAAESRYFPRRSWVE